MNKKSMETLLVIEELGNLTRAADFLGVTQPTLSKFLLKTEKDLNVKLFYRYSKAMKPSEEGAIYLNTFKRVLAEFRNAEEEVLLLRNEFSNKFSIGAHPLLARAVLAKIEKKIQRYKQIDLKYFLQDSRNITEEVAKGHIDFGLVADPQKYPDIVIKPLRKEFTGLYSKNGQEKGLLFYNSQMIFANKIINKIKFKKKKSVDDYETISSILQSGCGMGLLPSLVPHLNNKLQLIRKLDPVIQICLVYNSTKVKSKAMTKTISIIKEALRE